MNQSELKSFLDVKADEYERRSFIETDPISIPHQFTKREDIEIAGFLTATIAWGRRDLIIRSAQQLMEIMEFEPYQFVMEKGTENHPEIRNFYYRTFQGPDASYFVKALRHIYTSEGSLESVFAGNDLGNSIERFHQQFLLFAPQQRTRKHVSNPGRGSSAKRLCMYARWMTRNSERGVDFGIWETIDPAILMCPLDVHSGSVARDLGILKRKQNDWKAVVELTEKLRTFDADDPVKYDFALFGLGVFDQFSKQTK